MQPLKSNVFPSQVTFRQLASLLTFRDCRDGCLQPRLVEEHGSSFGASLVVLGFCGRRHVGNPTSELHVIHGFVSLLVAEVRFNYQQDMLGIVPVH